MEKGPFDEMKARHVFQQLMRCMAYCHSKGVFHRDIKADNILLDLKTMIVKVTDFGFAGMFTDGLSNEMMQTVCGTLSYMAPEILEKKGYYGASADVWSCGVVLFFLTTGCKLNRFPL